MERLLQWMIHKKYIENGQKYADFSSKAKAHLQKYNYEDYMKNWLEFMKFLIEQLSNDKEEELKNY